MERSKTDLATMSGRGHFVCHTEMERSSAPRATTEQILDVVTGRSLSRMNICGLYTLKVNQLQSHF
jgi:hypothetical protein